MYVAGVTTGGNTQSFLSKVSVNPQITFSPGSNTTNLIVTPISDYVTEGSETLTFSILAGTGYSIGTSVATGTISDVAAINFNPISSGEIQINGINIGPIGPAATSGHRQTQMLTAINAYSSNTGVTAIADVSTGGIKLSAADGRNIEVSTLTSASIANSAIGISLNGLPSGNRTVTTFRSSIDLSSINPAGITIVVSGGAATATGLSSQSIAATTTTVTTPAIDISTANGASNAIGVIDSMTLPPKNALLS